MLSRCKNLETQEQGLIKSVSKKLAAETKGKSNLPLVADQSQAQKGLSRSAENENPFDLNCEGNSEQEQNDELEGVLGHIDSKYLNMA